MRKVGAMHFPSSKLLPLSVYLVLGEAKALWSSVPAAYGPQSSNDYILMTGYPLGNGKLGGKREGPSRDSDR
jgi:alpha-L-fucosidase 2